MVLTRAQSRQASPEVGGPAGFQQQQAGVTASVTLGGRALSKAVAAKWRAGGGDSGSTEVDRQARWLGFIFIVGVASAIAILFASVSHAAYQLTGGSS